MGDLIEKQEVMKLLLKACPSYQDRWKEYFADIYDEGDEQLLYCDLGDFSDHLIELFKTNNLNEFPETFEIIELLHINGDEFVKEAATIGLLEGIQNVALNSDLDPNVFSKYLKPESLRWWNNLNDYWDGKTPYVGGDKS